VSVNTYNWSADESEANTPPTIPTVEPAGVTSISLDDRLREVERTLISWALKVSHGNKSRAAALLQIKRSTLGDRINRCGLGRPPLERAS
jgi:DNA-binding NtrC family response regulator